MSEKDPDGLQPGTPGAKLDAGKAPIMQGVLQYFPRALEQVALVSQFGSIKYSWGGYRFVKDGINRYSNAMGRHLLKEITEGPIDIESLEEGVTICHAAQVAWNALARLELMLSPPAHVSEESCTEVSSDMREVYTLLKVEE